MATVTRTTHHGGCPHDCPDTWARAKIFKLGRRVAVVHVTAWQDDENKPVAAGNGKFLL